MALTLSKYGLAVLMVVTLLLLAAVALGSIDAQEAAYPGATMTPILNSPTPFGYTYR